MGNSECRALTHQHWWNDIHRTDFIEFEIEANCRRSDSMEIAVPSFMMLYKILNVQYYNMYLGATGAPLMTVKDSST